MKRQMYLEYRLTVFVDGVNTGGERQTFNKDGVSFCLEQLADGRLHSLRWGKARRGAGCRQISFD